ncbi:hypothetical protein BDV95DRAFT_596503 [Massariosphaeria phaeospora]|uniref:C2H2-type domain-containing protein n=1 Tax=Massariosphaeria phaeospora TaxID=100035 RepID=A0A7C8I7V3_9PLEO|nr:hypothetical protein BDV95DRAFT_596503 [Massariosphaeria phaeospora]
MVGFEYRQNLFECPRCGYDIDRALRFNHYNDTGCYHVCEGCFGGAGGVWDPDSDEYWEHVLRDHVCTYCGQHYNSESNLQHHRITHREPTIDCLACPRKFTTYGGMIIHLEAGTCESGYDDLNLNRLAVTCYQSRKYTVNVYRCYLLSWIELDPGTLAFRCPTCNTHVAKLSSLFMHVDSDACGQTLDSGAILKLRRWLQK